ncbi:MAG: amidohydrolase family protein, partial [Candidatus Zixiibacteriota bacterium]
MRLVKRAARATLALLTVIVIAGLSQLTGAPQHQKTTPEYGIRDKSTALVAFTHATVVVSPELSYEDATLLIRDGRIAAAGNSVSIPIDAEVVDLKGKFIYPAFIEPYSEYGIERATGGRPDRNAGPQYEGRRVGVDSWNDAVQPEMNFVNEFKPDADAAKDLIEAGYAIAQSCRLDGVFRGRGFVALLNDGLPNDQILVEHSSHFLSFSKGSSQQEYPSSQMGSIALIRQTLMDADWYAKAQEAVRRNPAQAQIETNLSLAALAGVKSEPVVFDPEDELSLLRADKIAKEFGLKQTYLGSGYEYSIASQIKATGASLIVPVNFPKAPYVKTAEDALDVSLADLRHWEMAPSNLSILEKNQIEFAVTSAKLKERGHALANLRKAIKRGLTKETALAALTTVPAKLVGVADRAGTLEAGKLANFIITSGEIFDEELAIHSVWIAGTKHRVEEPPRFDIRGDYKLSLEANSWDLKITGKIAKPQGTLTIGKAKKELDNLNSDGAAIQFNVELDTAGFKGFLRFSGLRSNRDFTGNCALPNGKSVAWSATFVSEYDEKADSAKADSTKT